MKHGIILHNGPAGELNMNKVSDAFNLFNALCLHGWKPVEDGWYRRGIILSHASLATHWDSQGCLPEWAV